MLLTASLDFLSWRNKQAASEESDAVAQGYAIMRQLDATLGDAVDVETGARGFVATGQEQFLEPFNSAQRSLPLDLNSIRQLTMGQPDQMKWLAPITNDINFAVLASRQMVMDRRQSEDKSLLPEMQQGKDILDVVRDEIRSQQAEEARILNQRASKTRAKRNRSDFVMFFSTIIELSLLAGAWITVSRALLASVEAQELSEETNIALKLKTTQLEAANKELESFTYSVSHDLRAPLRHISGFSQILIEEFGTTTPPQAQRYMEKIAQGARKMGVLVDELLGLAGVGRHSLNLQTADINSVVLEIVSMLAPETQGRLVEWKIDDLGSATCDPVLIGQVFQNLIANALKFTRPRTTAVIEIGRLPESEHLTFFVRDNGVGFDMKYSDKLFGVFQRLHRADEFEGTGIGLATVRRIVQKHAGKTWAEAEQGNGATFYFTLALPKLVVSSARLALEEIRS